MHLFGAIRLLPSVSNPLKKSSQHLITCFLVQCNSTKKCIHGKNARWRAAISHALTVPKVSDLIIKNMAQALRFPFKFLVVGKYI